MVDLEIDEGAERVVDHRPVEAERRHQLGEAVDLGMGRVAEEQGNPPFGAEPDDVRHLVLEPPVPAQQIVALGQRLVPGKGLGMRLRVGVRVPPDLAPADLGVGVGVVEHGEPERDRARIDLFLAPAPRRSRAVESHQRARPAGDSTDILGLRPFRQRVADAGDRIGRAREVGDRLEQEPAHAGLRGELGERQRVLLAAMGVAVDVDRVRHVGRLGRVERTRRIAAPRRVGGDAALLGGGRGCGSRHR